MQFVISYYIMLISSKTESLFKLHMSGKMHILEDFRNTIAKINVKQKYNRRRERKKKKNTTEKKNKMIYVKRELRKVKSLFSASSPLQL